MEGAFGQYISSPLFTFSVGPNRKDLIVHSGPLADLSPTLHTLMNGEMIEAKVRRVEWPDVDEDTFVRFTEYAYLRDYTPPSCSYGLSNILDNTTENPQDTLAGPDKKKNNNNCLELFNGSNGSYPQHREDSLEDASQIGNYQGGGQALVEVPPPEDLSIEEPLSQEPPIEVPPSPDTPIEEPLSPDTPIEVQLPQEPPIEDQPIEQLSQDHPPPHSNTGGSHRCGFQGCCMSGNQQQGGGQSPGPRDPVMAPALGGHELPYREKSIWSRHLRGKFSTVNFGLYAHEMASKKTFTPRGNTELNEDFTPVFLGHASLYVLADKYGIESLSQLVLDKLKQTLKGFKLSAANVPDIIELVRYTYAHTPRLVTGRNELRTLVTMFIISSIGQIGETESFQELLVEGGDFVVDFWQIVWA
ncbi:hypothetical protein BDV36DRAFT_279106 [Aspergillus pseudocaelatus]|uniref:BTB domain-containing protein n=1 Tax=Aspergillus pseudocaelatus TaxID=1825620 RepID=A0ABQ6X2R7_9EURO|nr:hypothetical protein BDV36DRAFT_279106 [Aspergillus pseudocaelatus]